MAIHLIRPVLLREDFQHRTALAAVNGHSHLFHRAPWLPPGSARVLMKALLKCCIMARSACEAAFEAAGQRRSTTFSREAFSPGCNSRDFISAVFHGFLKLLSIHSFLSWESFHR
ncbi:MAG: hypothetical protein U1F57_00025 [bacterium]